MKNHFKFEQTFKDATELHKNISANLDEAEKNEEIARKNLAYWLLNTQVVILVDLIFYEFVNDCLMILYRVLGKKNRVANLPSPDNILVIILIF